MRTRDKRALEKRLSRLADAIDEAADRVRTNDFETWISTEIYVPIYEEVTFRGEKVKVEVGSTMGESWAIPLHFEAHIEPKFRLRLLVWSSQVALLWEGALIWDLLTPIDLVELFAAPNDANEFIKFLNTLGVEPV